MNFFFLFLLPINLFCQTIITLDPGHGGKDSGAIGFNGIKEKDITLAVALKLKKEIEDNIKNCKVVLTRDKDIFLPLSPKDMRSIISNHLKSDLFISLHVDASETFSGKGSSVYVTSTKKNTENKRKSVILASIIQNKLSQNLGFVNRGVLFKNLSVLRNTINISPSILIELGYISNEAELKFILGTGINKLVLQIRKGIQNYLEYIK